MGDRLAMVAFPCARLLAKTGSTLSTGLVFALYTLPYILFGTFAGVVIDRLNKRTIMVVADLLRAVLVVLVPVCLLPFAAARVRAELRHGDRGGLL